MIFTYMDIVKSSLGAFLRKYLHSEAVFNWQTYSKCHSIAEELGVSGLVVSR
jgi:hypothetical protein